MSRYLLPRPGGVLTWLSVRPPSLERRLFEHLLGAPAAVELNVQALASALRHPVQAIARALFALNRQASIEVQDGAASLPAASPALRAGLRQGIAGLAQDLIDISGGCGEIMLASDDGFCIAQAGLSAQQAQALAAHLPWDDGSVMHFRMQLCFADRTLYFCASSRIDLKHPVMLRLGAHLVQGCHLPATGK
ncbi:hypothetical protein [Polaromonas sp.]|uniref:hypothetical protein n=1 Tax=Polaromonas sp. TaxID=1869339 RepID=UPI003BB7C65F